LAKGLDARFHGFEWNAGFPVPLILKIVHSLSMTKLLEKAVETVRRLPSATQDEIARAMLTLAGDEGEPEGIDAAHLSAVLEGLAQATRREFATDAEVKAAFRRFEQ
jgi:hypothetical protein